MRYKHFVISLIIMLVLFAGFLFGFNMYTHGQLVDYLLATQSPNTPVPKTIIKQRSREPATGNTSEFNKKNKGELNYQATLAQFTKHDNLTSDDLFNMLNSNADFVLQIVDNANDKKITAIKNINQQKKLTAYTISSGELMKCSKKHHVQLLMTNRSVAYFKKGLVTSQFEPNSQKSVNKMQSLYTKWVDGLLSQLNIQQNQNKQQQPQQNNNNNKQQPQNNNSNNNNKK